MADFHVAALNGMPLKARENVSPYRVGVPENHVGQHPVVVERDGVHGPIHSPIEIDMSVFGVRLDNHAARGAALLQLFSQHCDAFFKLFGEIFCPGALSRFPVLRRLAGNAPLHLEADLPSDFRTHERGEPEGLHARFSQPRGLIAVHIVPEVKGRRHFRR